MEPRNIHEVAFAQTQEWLQQNWYCGPSIAFFVDWLTMFHFSNDQGIAKNIQSYVETFNTGEVFSKPSKNKD